MNRDIFEGKWEQTKGKLKQFWGWLTDDDLEKIEGDQTRIYGMLHERFGWSRERADEELKKFRDKFH